MAKPEISQDCLEFLSPIRKRRPKVHDRTPKPLVGHVWPSVRLDSISPDEFSMRTILSASALPVHMHGAIAATLDTANVRHAPSSFFWPLVDAQQGVRHASGEMMHPLLMLVLAPIFVQNRVKNANPPPAKRTKEEVRKDAEKARNSHRKGHGHHQKRNKRVAHPIKSDEDGTIIKEVGYVVGLDNHPGGGI